MAQPAFLIGGPALGEFRLARLREALAARLPALTGVQADAVYLADVAATIIARVQNWMRDEEDNQEEPVVIGVTPLDLSKLEKIKNLVGKAVVLAPRLFY